MYSGIVYDYIRILPDGYYAWGCVVRAIAITSGRDYKEIYNAVRDITGCTPCNGVHTKHKKFKQFMEGLGYE